MSDYRETNHQTREKSNATKNGCQNLYKKSLKPSQNLLKSRFPKPLPLLRPAPRGSCRLAVRYPGGRTVRLGTGRVSASSAEGGTGAPARERDVLAKLLCGAQKSARGRLTPGPNSMVARQHPPRAHNTAAAKRTLRGKSKRMGTCE